MNEVSPNFIDITHLCSTATVNLSRYSSPGETVKLNLAFSLLGLDPTNKDILDNIWNKKDINLIIRELLYITDKLKLIDYNKMWYKWLKNKIFEFNYRYLRKKLLIPDAAITYKQLFKLFLFISCDTNILLSQNAGKELDFFVASQYSNRYHAQRGLMTPIKIRTFLFPENYSIYQNFKSKNLIPAMMGILPEKTNFPIEKLNTIKQLQDNQYAPYIDFAVPIFGMILPKLGMKSIQWLNGYLQTLELLMIREDMIKRLHQRFLLSIEHLRVYNHIVKRREE